MTPCLLAVHAHPDDESITMGGTLARYAAAGVRVVLVTATLGDEGEVFGPALRSLAADDADQLGGYRWWEWARACAALGVTDHRILGGPGAFRDSGMVGTPSADHPRAFVRALSNGPDHRRAVGLLADIIAEIVPQVVLTYDADGGYGHPDHIAAHEVTIGACQAVADTQTPRVLAVVKPRDVVEAALAELSIPEGCGAAQPEDLGYLADADVAGVAVDVTGHATERQAALAAHATQLQLLDGGFALTNRIAQPLLPAEYYRHLAGPPLPSGLQDDLFVGL